MLTIILLDEIRGFGTNYQYEQFYLLVEINFRKIEYHNKQERVYLKKVIYFL